jgi:hypothetical protein
VVIGGEQGDQANGEAAESLGEAETVEVGVAGTFSVLRRI